MAVDKLVDSTQLDADLTSVANAIRTKGGTSAQLEFPDGFVDAIGDIQTGSGYTLDEVSTPGFPTVSDDVVMTVTKIRPALFRGSGIKSFSGPNVDDMTGSSWGTGSASVAFQNCALLESVSLPSLRTFNNSDYTFSNCPNLSIFDFDWEKCVSLGTGVFDGCEKLNVITLVLPLLASNIWASCFRNVKKLTVFDAYKATFSGTPQIRELSFAGTSLNKLILRGSGLLTLSNISAFQGTPFASDGAGGTLYVQQSLIANYQTATNWSTILSYTNNQILPIEGSIYETQYADGTPIT